MGEYAPDDQRDVHRSETAEWRETEQQQQQQRQSKDGDTPANMGYGNAHDAAGVSEQEKAQADCTVAPTPWCALHFPAIIAGWTGSAILSGLGHAPDAGPSRSRPKWPHRVRRSTGGARPRAK